LAVNMKAAVLTQQLHTGVITNELQRELIRKSIHLLIAFVPLFASIHITGTMFLLGAGIILYSYSEVRRKQGKDFLFITRITELASRDKDRDRFVLGPVTLGLGAMLALLFYPEPAATIAIYALAFGDGFSSLAGKFLGGRQIPLTGGKTFVGSLTCFMAVFLVVEYVSGAGSIAIMIAFAAMILELLPSGDLDNIIIPAGTGFIAYKLLFV